MKRASLLAVVLAVCCSCSAQVGVSGSVQVSGGVVFGTVAPPAPTLVSIAVADDSIVLPGSTALEAIGTYSDASTADVTTSCDWVSDNTGIATVNSLGVVVGVSAGVANISCTIGAKSDSAAVTVTNSGAGGGDFSACTLSDHTGMTEIDSCRDITSGGDYYVSSNLLSANSCIGVKAQNVTIYLDGHDITCGTNPQVFTYNDEPVTRSANNYDFLTRGSKGNFAPVASIIRVGNSPGASDYVYNVDFTIGADTTYNNGHCAAGFCSGNMGKVIIWIAGGAKPAVNQVYYVSYTVQEANGCITIANGGQNTTNFSTLPLSSVTPSNARVTCGSLTVDTNASAYSAGLFLNNAENLKYDYLRVETKAPGNFSVKPVSGSYMSGYQLHHNTYIHGATKVLYRDYYEGYSVRISDGANDLNGGSLHDEQFVGSPHGGLMLSNPGSSIYNSTCSLTNIYTNGFCFAASTSNGSIYNSTVRNYDAGNPNIGGRGIWLSANSCAWGNSIEVSETANNPEYNGCVSGGTYGIQTEGDNSCSYDNVITAWARDCDAVGLRFSDVGTPTVGSISYAQNETVRARRVGASTKSAIAISAYESDFANSIATPNIKGGNFRADTYVFKDTGGANGFVIDGATLGKDDNPAANYHTWWFENYNASLVTCLDCTMLPGASILDVGGHTDGASGGFYKHYDLWIKYRYRITITDELGRPKSTGVITLTDAFGTSYSAGADANGVAEVIIPAYRVYNSAAVVANTQAFEPYSLQVAAPGCSIEGMSGVSASSGNGGVWDLQCN